jgi:uncharacterized protein YhfF
MWGDFCAATGATGQPVDVFPFGTTADQADGLGELVLHGPKRATAGLVADFEADGIPLPQVGDHNVFVLGDGRPGGVLRTTDIRIGPLSSVDAQFAWDEGEGDRSLEYWLEVHRDYCRIRCAALDIPYSEDVAVAFERFELVWPVAGQALP